MWRLQILGLLSALGEVIAPPRCLTCLQELTWLCAACRQTWPAPALQCITCGMPHPRGLTCTNCRDKTTLTGAITAGEYSHAPLRRGIHWLKFKGVRGVAPTLAKLLLPQLSVIAPLRILQTEAVLVPIPLHPHRLRMRGFNQSEDIAQALSTFTGIPVASVLTRARSTWTQTKLTPELRALNMTGAFIQTDPLPPDRRYLLIVDDVTTTGSTLSAAAQAVNVPSLVQIWGCTIARG